MSMSGRFPGYRLAALAALSIAGCSDSKDAEREAPPRQVAQPAAPAPGGGSAITLFTLSSADIESAKLPGELGCGFSDASGAPLLIAMGDAASKDAAYGIVKGGRAVERIAAPGGFDAMVKGVTFTAPGTTVRIELTGSPIGDSEAPPIPAKMIYQRADGAERSYAGHWECGP